MTRSTRLPEHDAAIGRGHWHSRTTDLAFRLAEIGLLVGGLFVFALLPCEAIADRFKGRAPIEVISQILKLEQKAGFDYWTGFVNEPYSDELVELVLIKLDDENNAVLQFNAQIVLGQIIRQYGIAGEAAKDKVRHHIEQIIAEYSGDNAESSIKLTQLSRRNLWNLNYISISSPAERLKILKEHLESMTEEIVYYRYYYNNYEAITYLIDVGTEEARRILEMALEDGRERQRNPKILNRLQLSLDQVEIHQRLRELDAASKAIKLNELIEKHMTKKGLLEYDMVIWLIRKAESTAGTPGETVLNAIMNDQDNHGDYRYEAQEGLIRKGVLDPINRAVQFYY